jgi:cytosine/adenosine deaminase-related metal-dependent hydrolase
MAADTWTLRARWVLPGDGPPLEGGTVTVTGSRVAAVEPAGRRRADLDFGEAAVLPGLVNAHTHLDLGALRGRLPPPGGDFTAWLRAVIDYRRSSSTEEWLAAARAGVAESLRAGTTLVGDISTGGVSSEALAAGPLRATSYFELIGLTRPRARQAWADARAWLRRQAVTDTYRPGLSPHAPYTVRRGLFRLAARTGLPLAVHLAETRAELELLVSQTGPIRQFLESLGAWDPDGLVPALGWTTDLLARGGPLALAHGNYLEGPPARAVVVYCPRTHAYFGHPQHPFAALLRAGGRVALGTDSLASNPDLSVLAEMRFLWKHRRADLDGPTLLRMGTTWGAEALGWGHAVGTLRPGYFADLLVIPPAAGREDGPYEAVFGSDLPPQAVCLAGRWAHPAGATEANTGSS